MAASAQGRPTIVCISPYWRDQHRWMVSTVKLAELWQRLGYRVVVICMGRKEAVDGEVALVGGPALRRSESVEHVSETLTIYRKADVFLPDPLNFGIALGFTNFVRRILRAEQPRWIVVNKVLFWSSFACIPLRLLGYRVQVLTDALVGITWWPRARLPGLLMAAGAWTVGWLVLLAAQRVVFFHPQPLAILRRLGISAKSQVIPTGIDPTPYRTQVRSPKATCTVTYIGRLESVKGADDFLAAAVAVQVDHPELHIRVAGWCKPGNPLVEQYGHRVEFLGLREDVPVVLSETDIFVLPSYSEGLSNALMEAMSSGAACIATEVGGNTFLVQNGVSGLLFAPGDRQALAAHIRRLVEDPAKRTALGLAAQARIDAQFSWSIIGQEYRRFFGA
jgi:glycosyltransferase involved in cell wall biosynthesis